jgi:acyl-CoA thioester hydrolase
MGEGCNVVFAAGRPVKGKEKMKSQSKRIHKTTLRVTFADVDMAGIVYTQRFADYILRGWEEYFRAIGIPWESYVAGDKIQGLPVIRLALHFKSPARCGDEIDIITRITKITRRRIYFKFELFHGGEGRLLATGALVATAFDSHCKPTSIPDFILQAIDGKKK